MLGLKSISFHEPQKTDVQKPGMGFHSTHPCHNSPRQISASEASRFAESLSSVLTQLAADEESLCVGVDNNNHHKNDENKLTQQKNEGSEGDGRGIHALELNTKYEVFQCLIFSQPAVH